MSDRWAGVDAAVSRSLREKALELAARHADCDSTPEQVVQCAERWMRFMRGEDEPGKPSEMTRRVIQEIERERIRQITVEGWTTEHDDYHDHREMAHAAACYVAHYAGRGWMLEEGGLREELKIDAQQAETDYADEEMPNNWPWDENWWKPRNARADLVRAGALIVAELERLKRKEQSRESSDDDD